MEGEVVAVSGPGVQTVCKNDMERGRAVNRHEAESGAESEIVLQKMRGANIKEEE